MPEAYIVNGYRTAVGKAGRGGFRFTSPVDLGAAVIDYLIDNTPGFDPSVVEDIIVGNAVPEAEQGLQMGRWVGVRSKLPMEVPGVSVNRYCGSGIETISMAVAKIKAGYAECIIAGGTESMSLVPTVGYKTVPNYTIAKEHGDYFLGMGLTAEEVAVKYNISREDQDKFALGSHQKALKALAEGKFKNQIVPFEVEQVDFDPKTNKRVSSKYIVDTDEGPRVDTTLEALARLRPAFKNNGTVTAGNSSQTSDGASFVLVMSEKMVKDLGLEPKARLVSQVSVGVSPRYMGIGPMEAIPKALAKAGLSLKDIDQIELNEAFASQSLAVLRGLGINPDIVNVNGGAISLGHPLGCTGAKLTVQILEEMKLRNQKYGMVTACIGGGQGIAAVLERL
ncbi:thiolase family protein [Bacteroidia bacterium]|nr:thiolase family protein [Bacteroidia bacterium]MDC0104938.1 thiolase family protein [Bacteroidia bacterium]|tara:strand:+ start:271 stop:1452 length:1182 start_codon:yes stop_codon:yes gene_type:complete